MNTGDLPITSNNIDWTTIDYQKGQTIDFRNLSTYWPGRQRSVNSQYLVYTEIVFPREIAEDVSTITFTPSGYNEAFGDQGTIFSVNGSSNLISYSCSKSNLARNIIRVTISLDTSSFHIGSNHACVVNLSGTFALS